MDRYLAKLHRRPDHHKKRFALLASGTITLFIFGIWSLATFGMSGTSNEIVVEKNEVSPFQSLRDSLASSLDALQSSFEELKSGLKSVNLETEYIEMRDNALDVYGQ
jgi:hypothetical protein